MSFSHTDYMGCLIDLCEGLASPHSLAVALCLRLGTSDDFSSFEKLGPNDFQSPYDFLVYQQSHALYKKSAWLPKTTTYLDEGLSIFLKCENKCFETNKRLLNDMSDFSNDFSLLNEARSFIARVLSRNPPPVTDFHFTNGTNPENKGRQFSLLRKLSRQRHYCTPRIRSQVMYLLVRDRFTTDLNEYDCDELLLVEKQYNKPRLIARHTVQNLSFQSHYGSVLRACLRRAGLDIERAQDLHRALAEQASRDGFYCTIDLSNASDTIAIQTVKYLLPKVWYDALSSCRTAFTELDPNEFGIPIAGPLVRRRFALQKFSSQGNGFTFELETLIFWALSVAVARRHGFSSKHCFAYGDDIIMPSACFKDMVTLLNYSGFDVNTEKSYGDGYFRESCGGDYFRGFDVRPIFFKKDPSKNLLNAIQFINQITLLSEKVLGFRGRPFLRAWLRACKLAHHHAKTCGIKYLPLGYKSWGDGVVWDSFTKSGNIAISETAPDYVRNTFLSKNPPVAFAIQNVAKSSPVFDCDLRSLVYCWGVGIAVNQQLVQTIQVRRVFTDDSLSQEYLSPWLTT